MIAHIICKTAAEATEQLPSIKTIKKVTMKPEPEPEPETEPDKWQAKVLKTKCKRLARTFTNFVQEKLNTGKGAVKVNAEEGTLLPP